MAPIYLLSVYLLFLLAGPTTGSITSKYCNRGADRGGKGLEEFVKLRLFNQHTPTGTYLDCSIVKGSRISINRKYKGLPYQETKVVMHGFKSDGESMKNKMLPVRKQKENMIFVDWNYIAKASPEIGKRVPIYKTAAACAVEVGYYVGRCLRRLQVKGNKLHLFGHSLGAHGVGVAGRYLNKDHKDPPSRVTGMDPAGPCFTMNYKDENPRGQLSASILGMHGSKALASILGKYCEGESDIHNELRENKISPESGILVDIVHSNPGVFGAIPELGHIDYYVNGPKYSKCPNLKRSHSYAVSVVVASLQRKTDLQRKTRRTQVLYRCVIDYKKLAAPYCKKDSEKSSEIFYVGQKETKIRGTYLIETTAEC